MEQLSFTMVEAQEQEEISLFPWERPEPEPRFEDYSRNWDDAA